jgi:excisionase family DNA binding protein
MIEWKKVSGFRKIEVGEMPPENRNQNETSPSSASRQIHLPDRTDLDQLLTAQDVAALLRVPVSWVYERTRRRAAERIPHVRVGKYVRFEPQALRAFVARRRKG